MKLNFSMCTFLSVLLASSQRDDVYRPKTREVS